jgi:hypothetical protein
VNKRLTKMGRCTVTKGQGQRQLGRKIRKLENSVELSSKECKAKIKLRLPKDSHLIRRCRIYATHQNGRKTTLKFNSAVKYFGFLLSNPCRNLCGRPEFTICKTIRKSYFCTMFSSQGQPSCPKSTLEYAQLQL